MFLSDPFSSFKPNQTAQKFIRLLINPQIKSKCRSNRLFKQGIQVQIVKENIQSKCMHNNQNIKSPIFIDIDLCSNISNEHPNSCFNRKQYKLSSFQKYKAQQKQNKKLKIKFGRIMQNISQQIKQKSSKVSQKVRNKSLPDMICKIKNIEITNIPIKKFQYDQDLRLSHNEKMIHRGDGKKEKIDMSTFIETIRAKNNLLNRDYKLDSGQNFKSYRQITEVQDSEDHSFIRNRYSQRKLKPKKMMKPYRKKLQERIDYSPWQTNKIGQYVYDISDM